LRTPTSLVCSAALDRSARGLELLVWILAGSRRAADWGQPDRAAAQEPLTLGAAADRAAGGQETRPRTIKRHVERPFPPRPSPSNLFAIPG